MQNHMICLGYPHGLINCPFFMHLKASGPVPLDRKRRPYYWLQLGGVNTAGHCFLCTTNLSTARGKDEGCSGKHIRKIRRVKAG